MARRPDAPDRWARLLGPAERSVALLAESLHDPVEPVRRPRRRWRDRLVRLVRRLVRRFRR